MRRSRYILLLTLIFLWSLVQAHDSCPTYVTAKIAEIEALDVQTEFNKAKARGNPMFIPTPAIQPDGFNINGLPYNKHWPNYPDVGINSNYLDPKKIFHSCQLHLVTVFDKFASSFNSLVAAEFEK